MTPASTKLMTKENVAEGNAKTQLTGTKATKSRNADKFTNGLRLPVVAMLSAAIADNGDEDQDSLSTRHCQKQWWSPKVSASWNIALRLLSISLSAGRAAKALSQSAGQALPTSSTAIGNLFDYKKLLDQPFWSLVPIQIKDLKDDVVSICHTLRPVRKPSSAFPSRSPVCALLGCGSSHRRQRLLRLGRCIKM